MTAETPLPRGAVPARPSAPRWLLLPLAALPFWAVLPWAAPEARTLPVLAASAVPLVLLLALAVLLDRRDRRIHDLGARLDALRADTASLADEHLPLLARRLRAGDSADTALRALPLPADRKSVV